MFFYKVGEAGFLLKDISSKTLILSGGGGFIIRFIFLMNNLSPAGRLETSDAIQAPQEIRVNWFSKHKNV